MGIGHCHFYREKPSSTWLKYFHFRGAVHSNSRFLFIAIPPAIFSETLAKNCVSIGLLMINCLFEATCV